MSLGWKWFIEYQTPHSAHMHGIVKVVHSQRSEFQQIDIFDTEEYGRMLVLDGKVQSTLKDEFIYHESLVHPIMLAHPEPKRVLIIGGGEGGTLREVLRHPSVESVVMVDIDAAVIEGSRKHMPALSGGAFEDSRAEIVIGDGRRYIEGRGRNFDAIIVDVTDPLEGGPAALLYTAEFYKAAFEAVDKGGAIVTQASSTYYSTECFATIVRTVGKVFGAAGGYNAWVPSYDSMWGFAYGTRGKDPRTMDPEHIDRELKRRKIGGLRFYDGKVHRALFALPKDVVRCIGESDAVATDADPTFMPI
jgi:spermidine synthase